jgi:thymidylate synthase
MQNYNELIRDVLLNGVDKPDRTGIGSKAVFGRMLRWDLSEGFPLQTTRRVPLRIAFEETMFFLRGQTDTKILEDKNVNIWKGNTTREFLDSRGLAHLPEGSMGAGYSHQWRNFGGDVGVPNGVDQIKLLLDGLKHDPGSRRHIVTAWNPQQLSETPLPPCHITNMYSVIDNKLNSSFIMRSNDVPFGLPFNIAGYALLNHIFASHLGMIPGELVYFGWDVHIYQNQIDMCNEILEREPRPLPTLNIKKSLSTFDDILSLEWGDIELLNYDPHLDIKNKPGMAI